MISMLEFFDSLFTPESSPVLARLLGVLPSLSRQPKAIVQGFFKGLIELRSAPLVRGGGCGCTP